MVQVTWDFTGHSNFFCPVRFAGYLERIPTSRAFGGQIFSGNLLLVTVLYNTSSSDYALDQPTAAA